MNKWIGTGRLASEPEIRYSNNESNTCVARYRIAVKRKFHKEGEPDADFFNCVALGKNGEFVEKYLKKGTKIVVTGRLQSGSYEKDGVKHYTTEILVEEHEFAESKKNDTDFTSVDEPPFE